MFSFDMGMGSIEEFNPKKSIIKEDLAVSGIEMSIDPVIIGGVLSGVSSVVGGIFGSNNAKKNEAAQKKAIKEAKLAAKRKAKALNKYNKKKFNNDKENFLMNREFNFEQAMKRYEYDTQVQAIQYDTQMRAYRKDQTNLQNQLKFNKIAERQAYMREQSVLRDIRDENSFNRLDVYIDSIKTRGTAANSPAGASGDRAILMSLAEKGRQLAVLDASYQGAVRESSANMFDIAINKYGADMRAKAQTMLKPSAPIPLIKPEMTPLPKFTKPMKLEPEYISGYVPSADTVGPLISGIGGAVSSLAGLVQPNQGAFTPAPSFTGNKFDSFNANMTGNPFVQ